eukprot:scaffold51418_cov24-Prasinocladus_malaysianus.AAC.1
MLYTACDAKYVQEIKTHNSRLALLPVRLACVHFICHNVEIAVGGQMTFEDDTFAGNEAHTGGTGAVSGSAEVSFFQCKLQDSAALGHGGAISASGSKVQVNFRHVTIENSVAGDTGGCVALEGGSSLFAQSTVFHNCKAGNTTSVTVNSGN